MKRYDDAVVIAIDGPSGSGKSTVARRVAQHLGYRYLDTGSLYRALTWRLLQDGADPEDPDSVAGVAHRALLVVGTDPVRPSVAVDGRDVTTEIRAADVTAAVSAVSRHPELRARLLGLQREVIGAGGIVVEGRDIGTTVCPDAPLKIFLTASPAERANRRHGQAELATPTVAATRAAIEQRDALDAGRAASPLVQAADAHVIDSTGRSVDDVVALILDLHRLARVGEPK